MKLFLLFFFVPLIEIYFLIQVGSVVGAPLTIILVVLSAVIGAALIRHQGFTALQKFQQQSANGEVPAMVMLEGLCLFVAGAMLFTPGFFTDAIGFALLTPPLRRIMIQSIARRGLFKAGGVAGHAQGFEYHTSNQHSGEKQRGGRIIDVDSRDGHD